MKLPSFVLATVALSISHGSGASDDDGVFESMARALASQPNENSCPISITARAVQGKDRPYLAFVLANTSGRTLTFAKQDLPWGHPNSVQIAALTTKGEIVPGLIPLVDDFGIEEVSLSPGQTLRGNYDLEQRWSRKSDPPTGLPRGEIVVFLWVYKVMAEEFHNSLLPVCRGITAIGTAP